MDGYAVRSADLTSASLEAPVTLKVIGEVTAGHAEQLRVGPGQSARITTGAALPEGADAVVPVEWTGDYDPQAGKQLVATIDVPRGLDRGDYVRPSGLDVQRGETVLTAGTRLTVQAVGLLAATGRGSAHVFRKPRVGVFSTGDELREPGEELPRGAIFGANGPMIRAALWETGAAPIWLGLVADTRKAVEAALDRAVAVGCDLITSTAGVSMGSRDFVRLVLEDKGSLEFWRVNIRPGKPLAFGSLDGIPFVGLPGNPVSAWMTFNVFVRPAVRRLAGQSREEELVVPAVLEEGIDSDGRESYLRATVHWDGSKYRAKPSGNQDSSVLSSLVAANALLVVPEGIRHVEAGSDVDAWMFGDHGLPMSVPPRAST